MVASDDANLRVEEGLPEGNIHLMEDRDLAGVMMDMNERGSDAYLVGRSLIRLGRRPSSRRRWGLRLGTYVVSTGSPDRHTWAESPHPRQADGL